MHVLSLRSIVVTRHLERSRRFDVSPGDRLLPSIARLFMWRLDNRQLAHKSHPLLRHRAHQLPGFNLPHTRRAQPHCALQVPFFVVRNKAGYKGIRERDR